MPDPNLASAEIRPSIADYLAAARWKHALFTTYALSLSYFESEVLRPLLQGGCDDIWLIADAEGYRTSLLERRSMRVGQEYRLIPVAMPNGVLHAKSIYLCNDDEDLLLIGSGNVTFGGHGRNTEVFEALTPDSAPRTFSDYAGFLASLGSRQDIRIAQRDWIDDFVERAQRAADREIADDAPIRLIHSLEERVCDQLPSRFSGFGPCEKATILSPYHDPDGQAVKTLLQNTDTPAAGVAVSPGETTPFPFDQTSAWNSAVEPVSLAQQDKRFVHAKWYEFEFEDRRVLLTGSINATRKALTTTDNAEIGVLRILPRSPGPIAWQPADTPEFQAMKRLPSGLGGHEIVYAAFDRADTEKLSGQLLSAKDVEGVWKARLVQADGESFSTDISVNANGTFSVSDPGLEALSGLPALQIILKRGDRSARGWVHNEMLLSVGARRRLTAGALSRMMRREGSDDDLQALLDYFSNCAERHLVLFDQPVRTQGEEGHEERQTAIVTVHIDEIAPLSEGLAAVDPKGGRQPPLEDRFNVALLRLRRVLLGHGSSRNFALEQHGDETLAEEDLANDSRTVEDRYTAIGLREFELAINKMISEAEERSEVANQLLVLLLEMGMWTRLTRLNDKEGAHEFLNGWFFRACRIGRQDEDRVSALNQHVVTAAAALYCMSSDSDGRAVLGVSLHGALEQFYRGRVDREHAVARLISDPHAGFGAMMLASAAEPDLVGALLEVLELKTRRQQLCDALDLAESGQSVPDNWEVFESASGRELLQRLQSAEWKRRVRTGPPERSACSHCYFQFAKDESNKYRTQRFVQCIHCRKFTVDTTP